MDSLLILSVTLYLLLIVALITIRKLMRDTVENKKTGRLYWLYLLRHDEEFRVELRKLFGDISSNEVVRPGDCHFASTNTDVSEVRAALYGQLDKAIEVWKRINLKIANLDKGGSDK